MVDGMEYQILGDKAPRVCEIVVSGDVDPAQAISMLDHVWQAREYRQANYVIWNLEMVDAFPDFNHFVLIVNHARKHKPKLGPTQIAFCSSSFANSMLVKVLKGFTRTLPHKMGFFSTPAAALDWFVIEEPDVA